MAKVLIVISSDIYVRNYLTTDALTALEEQFECHFIADNAISMKELLEQKSGFRGYYSIDDSLHKKHRLLFNLMMWRHRRKSRTFHYRWLRNSRWHMIDRSHGTIISILSTLKWLGSASLNPEGLVVPLLGNRLVFPLSSRLLRKIIPPNEDLKARIAGEKYDVVMFPSAAFDAVSVDIARACEDLGVSSLCLIDNWDNLTSKTVFWAKPTYLGVWGPQARDQAMKIHGFAPPQIYEIGTPRFDQYVAAREGPTKPPYNYPYVLFVGSAMPFDEISALHLIDKFLVDSPSLPPELHVVYRPHPWQQKRQSSSVFSQADFRRVVLDKQIQDAQQKDRSLLENTTRFQPDLSYYPNLLMGASCVVGPLTTMLLEAALCLRPVIGINYSDGVHSNTSRQYFSHFDGADNIPGFSFCDKADDLGRLIEHSVLSDQIRAEESSAAIGYFLNQSPVPYPTRLVDTVHNIIAKSSGERPPISSI